jgi:hypothetical protein
MEEWPDFGAQLDQETVERLREIVDPVSRVIVERRVTASEARELIDKARLEAALVIPDQMERYDLIYGSRFARLLEQFPPRAD